MGNNKFYLALLFFLLVPQGVMCAYMYINTLFC